MNKAKITGLLLLVLLSFRGMALDRTVFDKAVDYCNCRITYAYLEQFTGKMPAGKAEKAGFENIKADFGNCTAGNSIGYNELDGLMNNNSLATSNEKLSAVINGIKGSYKEDLNIDEAANLIIESIYSQPSLKSVIATYGLASLKPVLKNGVSTILSQPAASGAGQGTSPGSAETTGLDQTETRLAAVEERVNDMPGSFSVNWLSLVIAFICAALVFIYLYRKISELESKLSRQERHMESLKGKLEQFRNNPSGSSKNTVQDNPYNRSLEEQLDGMRKAIERLQVDYGTSISAVPTAQGQEAQSPPATTKGAVRQQVLFASMPAKDGSFHTNTVTRELDATASFYKLTLTDGGQKATFEFLGDSRSTNEALMSPGLILEPVCRIQNGLNQNAKRIKTVEPGVIIRRNNKWELEKHALIEYE